MTYVKNPKNKRNIFLNNAKSSYEDRLEEVMAKVLSNVDIIQYCEDNGYIKNKQQELSYKQMERILENCATYLLQGQYKENDIMTIFNIRKAQVNELPASSLNGNTEDLMYAENDPKQLSPSGIVASGNITYHEDTRSELMISNRDIQKRNKKELKRKKKYKDSKAYRLEMLHSTKPIRTYKIKQQFYKDENDEFIRIDGKKQPIKNAWGQPVFDAEYMTIGGRDGIINEQNLYKTVWKTIDINNEFWYNTHRFKIDKGFEPYQVRDNKNDMDKILIVPIEDGLVFYDQNIKKIPDDVINMIS